MPRGARHRQDRSPRQRRGFSFIELMVVVGIIGLFAGVVIPGLAASTKPLADPVAQVLEADLLRARTEAMMRGESVVAVASPTGDGWWIARASAVDEPIDGTLRVFGRGGFAAQQGLKLVVPQQDDARVFARFDSLGARDEGVPTLELKDAHGASLATWRLDAGRAKLSR